MKINFIGIGAQKCASTWIHRVLSDHPEVVIYPGKEIDFFSVYYDRGYQWYEKQLGKPGKATVAGEVSTSYFADSDSPERVFHYNPDMRIILSLRDPIERAFSNHLHEVRLQHMTGQNLTFEAGLENNPMYLLQSRYSLHLARWLTVFPISQILVLFQEDIRDDAIGQSRKLYQFLGISDTHHSEFLKEKINVSQRTKYPHIERLARTAGRLGRALGANHLVEKVKKNNWVRHFRQYNEVNLRHIVPVMHLSTKKQLEEMLAEDVLELSRQLGRTELPWPIWQIVKSQFRE